MLTTMTNQQQRERRHRMFTIFVLRLLERDKQWSADTVDEISYAAMDLCLADMDSEGNFKVIVDNE
ncbi:MAG: hypothetical protein RLZZ479_1148 [Bacteroidota bacterium]|jgi:hypothetical protein